jgi:hypothetical protein
VRNVAGLYCDKRVESPWRGTHRETGVFASMTTLRYQIFSLSCTYQRKSPQKDPSRPMGDRFWARANGGVFGSDISANSE